MNSPQALTARQLQVFKFIQSFRRQAGKAPSYQQIAAEIGVASTATIFDHVRALRKKGWLPGATRTPYAVSRGR